MPATARSTRSDLVLARDLLLAAAGLELESIG
jgi:hypothetical protein